MRTGKISEAVLKRSVLKNIKNKGKNLLVGPAPGADVAALEASGELVTLTTQPVVLKACGRQLLGMKGAVHKAINNLAVSNSAPVGVALSILLPEQTEESSLQQLMKEAESVCTQLEIQIIGGHTEVTPAVCSPIVTVTGIGMAEPKSLCTTKGAAPGEALVVTKWIALEGTALMAALEEEALLAHYPRELVQTAKGFDAYLSVLQEAKLAIQEGATAMHDLSQGGIFGALWELAQASSVGLDVDFKKIPVRQETIEVCNQLDINPYELLSGGSLLLTVKDGNHMVERLSKVGIPAAVIGETTAGNDRIIRNRDEIRYLEPPKSDQIYKNVYNKEKEYGQS